MSDEQREKSAEASSEARQRGDSEVDFDYSAKALFEPGEAENFFSGRLASLRFQSPDFCLKTACTLAELARLIYRKGSEEGQHRGPDEASRQDSLARVGLRETAFLCEGSAQAAVLSPEAADDDVNILVFRGTDSPQDWLANLDALLIASEGGGHVHKGFAETLDSIWEELAPLLQRPGRWLYTGHSLGAALATLCAARRKPDALYTFGSPRVGSGEFRRQLEGVPIYRVVNSRDVVTSLPLPLTGIGFEHLGEQLYFTTDGELWREPSESAVALDRLRWEGAFTVPGAQPREFTDLPKFMTDHAPINYLAQLARHLPTEDSA